MRRRLFFTSFITIALIACKANEVEPAAHDTHAASAGHDESGDTHGAHEGHSALPAADVVADTSLFQLETTFTDEANQPFTFGSLAGKQTLVVMFYGSCETICPALIEETKRIDQTLTPTERERTRVVVITFDPEHDTPERLVALAASKGLLRPRWTFLRGNESATREIATVLGVQYRRLPDGNFAHSAVITLLDAEGRIVERIEGLGQSPVAMIDRLRRVTP